MGNKTPPPQQPPPAASKAETKRTKDIRQLAKYISSSKCSNIVLMLGAGVSTSAGIPDFRSPKTGLYSNLARLNLPHPEAVFEINFFRKNPVPFYTLASELYPGAFRPTPTHAFIKLLLTHGLLHMCFTQNIDTLERRAGVPANKIVEAHGSFATQRCIDCKRTYPDDAMRECVLGERAEGEPVRIPRCERKGCGGLVKPDIVFFGEALPDRFISHLSDVGDADLLLILGTSLTVHPFASLAGMADHSTCRRVLINLERVGDMGRRPGDVVLLGECDVIVRELCDELGWGEELEKEWKATAMEDNNASRKEKEKGPAAVDTAASEKRREEEEREGRKEFLEKEVEKMTEAIAKQLDLEDPTTTDSEKTKATSSNAPEPKSDAIPGPVTEGTDLESTSPGDRGQKL